MVEGVLGSRPRGKPPGLVPLRGKCQRSAPIVRYPCVRTFGNIESGPNTCLAVAHIHLKMGFFNGLLKDKGLSISSCFRLLVSMARGP